jgi:hypothetical protein
MSQAVDASNQDLVKDLIQELTGDLKGLRESSLRLMARFYGPVMSTLIVQPEEVPDAGEELRAQLLLMKGKAWQTTRVANPTLGYDREYTAYLPGRATSNNGRIIPLALQPHALPNWDQTSIRRNQDNGNGNGDDEVPSDAPANVASITPFRKSLALSLMLWDRHAYSDSLIPTLPNVLGADRDHKEAFFGSNKGQLEQMDRLTALPFIYLRQADALFLHFQDPYWKAVFELTWSLYPRERPMLETYRSLREHVMSEIPIHPLLKSLVDMYARISVETVFGTKPMLCRLGYGSGSGLKPDANPTYVHHQGSGPRARDAQLMLAVAYADSLRLKSLVEAGERWPIALIGSFNAGEGRTRLNSAATLTSLLSQQQQSVGSLAEWLVEQQRFVKYWPELLRTINWPAPVSADPFTVLNNQAYYCWTDGEGTSEPPVALLSGMCVGLPITNRAALVYPLKLDDSFNSAPLLESIPAGTDSKPAEIPDVTGIRWTTLTPRGYIAGVAGGLTFQRYYMPHGMIMGEDFETQMFVSGFDDRISDSVKNFYRERSPNGYVRERYAQPLRTASTRTLQVSVSVTDWEVSADGTDGTVVQNAMLETYGTETGLREVLSANPGKPSPLPAGPNVDASFELFAFREQGFNMRIPVQIARRGPLEFLNYQGALTDRLEYNGIALFDGRATLPYSVQALDPYINLLIVEPDPLLGPLADEITSPERPAITE